MLGIDNSIQEAELTRDELAMIRTQLANERTFLAYVRTSLAFIAAGAGMIHFFQSISLRYVGWFFLVAGGVILVVGALSFVKRKQRMAEAKKKGDVG